MSNERPRVLVIDEVPAVIRMLSLELRTNGYDVVGAEIGSDLFELIARDPPAVIILELVLPGPSGLEVLKELRARFPDLPVIVLTTQDTEADRNECLELGATDFLGKPFSPEDLSFRIDLATRRVSAPPKRVRLGPYDIDLGRRLIRKHEQPFSLTTTEWAILLALIDARGAVSVERLTEVIFGRDGTTELTLYWMLRLRERLEADPRAPRLIVGGHRAGFALGEG